MKFVSFRYGRVHHQDIFARTIDYEALIKKPPADNEASISEGEPEENNFSSIYGTFFR